MLNAIFDTDYYYPRNFYKQWEFIIPATLSLLFLLTFFHFNPHFYLFLGIIMVVLIQLFPLRSRMTEYIVFLCFPVIGAIANVHDCCLNYNSTVLFLLCRSYALYNRLKFRHMIGYLLLIASWFFYTDAPFTIYMGGIMHGMMHPINFILLRARSKWLNWSVLIWPIYIGLDNVFQYKKYLVAFWDLEIFLVYLGWALGHDKETVVKRLILFSFPLVNFAQIYWDVCPITVVNPN